MSPLIFPKMLFSHEEGWSWLMRIHPTVTRLYLSYVVPLSLIPPVMLFYAWYAYRDAMFAEISMGVMLSMCVIFYVVELVMVPVMGAVLRRVGEVADLDLPYQDAFAMAAVAPTPLWIAPLFLFVPSLLLNSLVLALALLGSGMLIYQGVPKVFRVDDEGKSLLLAGSVIAAGLVAWVAMMVLAFVLWGFVVA
ncbi:MAG: DUF1282 family protein [Rhodocyclales bacterium]|nr:DUF1282 family protein [Rhodocyclales bacterium]